MIGSALKALGDPDAAVRREACAAVGPRSIEPEVFNALLALLADESVGVDAEAALDRSSPTWRTNPESLELVRAQLMALGSTLSIGEVQDDWQVSADAVATRPSPDFSVPAVLDLLLRAVGDRTGLLVRMLDQGEVLEVRRAALELRLRESEPRLARSIAIERSNDPEPALRLRALQTLVKLDTANALDVALKTAADPSPLLRAFAARVLASLSEPRAQQMLQALLDDSAEDVRVAVLKSLKPGTLTAASISISSLLSRGSFRPHMATASANEAVALLRCLHVLDKTWAWTASNRELLIPLLDTLLRSASGEDLATAIHLTAASGARELVPRLVAVLVDAEASRAARDALDALNAEWRSSDLARQGIEDLQAVVTGGNHRRAVAAVLALAELGDFVHLRVLVAELSRAETSKDVVEAFERAPWEDLLPALSEALADPRDEVRERALGLLTTRGIQRALPLIERVLLEDAQPSVRLKALELCDSTSVAIDTLRLLLADPDPRIRDLSARLLGQGAATEAIQNLVERLTDESPSVRASARVALERIDPLWPGTRAALNRRQHIEQALDHASPEVRAAAAAVLGLVDSFHGAETAVAR